MVKTDQECFSYFCEKSIGSWESDTFMAFAYKDGSAVRLDINRKDGKDGITWDEMQAIKNACGYKEQDAIEFYPAEADVINTGNFRHLYIFNEKLPLIRRK